MHHLHISCVYLVHKLYSFISFIAVACPCFWQLNVAVCFKLKQDLPFSASRVFERMLIFSILRKHLRIHYLDDGRPSRQMRGTDAQW